MLRRKCLHDNRSIRTKIIRACYFRPRFQHSNLLYLKLGVLKLDYMIKMELAKFIFKFNNQMLPSSFNNYFINLNQVHKYNTRQKFRNEFYHFSVGSESGKKTLQCNCLNIWRNIPQEFRPCSFTKFKKYFKTISLA